MGRLKKYLDFRQSQEDLFHQAELKDVSQKWSSPKDFFNSLVNELTHNSKIQFVKLRLFENRSLRSSFSAPEKFTHLTDEISQSLESSLGNIKLSLQEILKRFNHEEKILFDYKALQGITWKLSESIYATLLVASKDPEFLTIPFYDRYESCLRHMAELFKTHQDLICPPQDLNFMVGESKAMRVVKDEIRRVAKVNYPVLITGESGTGKDLVARAIHQLSSRSHRSWVPLNCAAIPEQLLESELFGYKKGAFTGAQKDKGGLIEEADGGTLFLDEIADLPILLQAKLLRVLQEKEIRRLGDTTVRKVDFRLVSATNKNLKNLVEQDQFREDLFFRIEVLKIHLPPLRERQEDIPLLARHFLDRHQFKIPNDPQFQHHLDQFETQEWPGNIREFESAIKRLITYYPHNVTESPGLTRPGLIEARDQFEKSLLERTLMETGGNKTQAAELLKISRPYLSTLTKKHDIEC